jgi:hypothetical protein
VANRTTTTTTTTTPSAIASATTTTITNRPHTLVLLTPPYPVSLFQDGGGVSGAASLILQPVLQYGKSGCVHNPLMYDDWYLTSYLVTGSGRAYCGDTVTLETTISNRRATPREATTATHVPPHATACGARSFIPRPLLHAKSLTNPPSPLSTTRAAGTAQRRRGGRGHHVAYRHHRRDLDGNT